MRAEASIEPVEPTEEGWYAYRGAGLNRGVMLFHLRTDLRTDSGRQWSVHLDNGESCDCSWSYIAQALSVWDLVRLDLEPAGALPVELVD